MTETLGHYALLEHVGTGGLGELYRAAPAAASAGPASISMAVCARGDCRRGGRWHVLARLSALLTPELISVGVVWHQNTPDAHASARMP
ncbi:MAG: hypothetical protein QGG24_03680 [Vicinamibacterales bacterium]|jgi:hypothetical protein|nr:hypothetical protein [Acidobacteriota bacterium]MDP7294401.1 hypothetical protein [Vicinamibacterales bacterium]MDP7672629.1 hypothetical protein [Vicinamibacterales bacterium]HJO36987.1 hypothetical protein [Vicinamibacterales bacterium]